MANQQPYRIIITTGGTGGHIFPAIAVANTLKDKLDQPEILFVGAKGKMEMKKVPEAGYEIIGLWISGIRRKLTLDNLLFPVKLLFSILKSRKIIRKFRPQVAIGFGGYASGPLMYAATHKGIPAMISEQNAFAGLANKWLAKKVQKIGVASEGMEKFFPAEKIILTGNPVRKGIITLEGNPSEARRAFDLRSDLPTILVIGGSLGARSINESIIAGLQSIIDANVQLLWQTGAIYYEEMKARTATYDLTNIRLLEFIKNMDQAYMASDVVISRAGALSIAELCLVKKPVVFMPSPNVAEDHQTKNARYLVDKKAALMVKDSEGPVKLVKTALTLLQSEETKKQLSLHIGQLARPNAAEDIADEVIKLIEN